MAVAIFTACRASAVAACVRFAACRLLALVMNRTLLERQSSTPVDPGVARTVGGELPATRRERALLCDVLDGGGGCVDRVLGREVSLQLLATGDRHQSGRHGRQPSHRSGRLLDRSGRDAQPSRVSRRAWLPERRDHADARLLLRVRRSLLLCGQQRRRPAQSRAELLTILRGSGGGAQRQSLRRYALSQLDASWCGARPAGVALHDEALLPPAGSE